MESDAPGAGRAFAVVCSGVLLATSTWFSGTAVTPQLVEAWHLESSAGSWLTIAVQAGFIVGTLVYALTNLADVFNARRVFFASAVAGAIFNGVFGLFADGLVSALILRFCTGLTLAGVYPVGMKIVASWFRSGLGWRLGVMVGALTLGTAFPYLLRAIGAEAGWRSLVLFASGAAVAGGVLVLVGMGDGPYLRSGSRFDPRILVRVFRDRAFRLTALGYFGHMWELYAFWALVSSWLYASEGPGDDQSWRVFAIIGVGAFGCAAGGWLSRGLGERRVALGALTLSCCACVVSGFAYSWPPAPKLAFLLAWGVVVVADSPQFSALAARFAPRQYVGTALTVQNGVGFALTIVSIQLVSTLAAAVGWRWVFLTLAIGPLLGAVAVHRLAAYDTEIE